METKANFVLIGAVTVLGLLGTLGLLIWFAKVEIDRQYDLYETLFDDVSGLGMAGDVRFNGLSVGKVIGLALDSDDPDKVRVRVEVASGTPIKTDTVAQLNAQGVTGVSFVALSGGSPGAPALNDATDPGDIPLIRSERSAVQALTEDAPDLVHEAVAAIKEFRAFLGADNQAAVTSILQNLDRASGALETALSDFSDISRTVSEATAEISKFTGRLDDIGGTAQGTLTKINETLDLSNAAIAQIEPALRSASAAFATADATMGGVDTLIQSRVPQIADDLSAAIRSFEATADALRVEVDTALNQFGGSADAATQRFQQLEATIAALDVTLAEARASFAAVKSASNSFQGLVDGDGTVLVAEVRAVLASAQATITSVDQILQDQVPALVSDIRAAVQSASLVIDGVKADVGGIARQIEPLIASGDETLKAATLTLQNANTTLANLDLALAASQVTLDAATGAFAQGEALLSTDLGPALSDIRAAAGQFETTMAALSQDIPQVTADLRQAMARALDVIARIDDTVSASAPPIESFARSGLPEFTRFAQEAQKLVLQLEQLTKKLERDPARFFFGNTLPEFRR